MNLQDFKQTLKRLHKSLPSYGEKMRSFMVGNSDIAEIWFGQYHIESLEVQDLTKAIDQFATSQEKPKAHDEWLQKVVEIARTVASERKRIHEYKIAPTDTMGRKIATVRCRLCEDTGGVICWSLSAMRSMRDKGHVNGVPDKTMAMSCSGCEKGDLVESKMVVRRFNGNVYVPFGPIEALKTRILDMGARGLTLGKWAHGAKELETASGNHTSAFDEFATEPDEPTEEEQAEIPTYEEPEEDVWDDINAEISHSEMFDNTEPYF
jgi:hypothetical protein